MTVAGGADFACHLRLLYNPVADFEWPSLILLRRALQIFLVTGGSSRKYNPNKRETGQTVNLASTALNNSMRLQTTSLSPTEGAGLSKVRVGFRVWV